MNHFYITTPLYYINDIPHLGTSYTTVVADVLNRYHQLIGYDTFLLTGTDEHGQKCSQSAKQKNIPVQAYCDEMSKRFENVWKSLDISYNLFFRTTYSWHKQAVQESLQQLYDKNLIYESTYEGWYCTSEEIFYTSKDLIDGKSPTGKEVVKIKEKNYFFKMSAFQKSLMEYIDKHPNFIQPSYRKNEIIGFLKNNLEDLCISRPKNRLEWGVEIPFNSDYVTYVWIDALLNYATGIGYQQKNRKQEFDKWWTETGAIHLIGKDILLTHCVYWPCLLMALEIKLPKTILAHGWLLNQSQEKMSKSKGDVVDPLTLLESFDSDSLRYFLTKIPIGNDAPVSHELIIRQINEDLVNNLGNLLRRTTTMIHKHFDSQIPERGHTPGMENLRKLSLETLGLVKENILILKPHLAIEKIIHLLNETNKFLEQNAPWKKIKTDKKETGNILRASLDVLYLSSVLLKPIMPKKMNQLLNSLSCEDKWPLKSFQEGSFPKTGTKIKELPPFSTN